MSQAQDSVRATNKTNAGNKPTTTPPVDERKGDLVIDLWIRFHRFRWDAAGVSLIAFALITLIGLLNRTLHLGWAQGFFISFWADLIARGFGWGWPMAVIALGVLGLLCLLRRRSDAWPHFHLWRVLAIEAFAFCWLVFLAILGGWSLDNAEAGQDGGIIGWGLATLLDKVAPPPWSTAIIVALLVFLASYGSGLLSWLLHRLENWLDVVNPSGAAQQSQADVQHELHESPSPEPEQKKSLPIEPPAPLTRSLNLPPLTLLQSEDSIPPNEKEIKETAVKITQTLGEYGVPAKVIGFMVGPTVTQYAVEPGYTEKLGPDGEVQYQKVRVSQISALSRDLALALSAERLRIEAPVPGRSYVGIEVPNRLNSVVRLRSLLECEPFLKLNSPLSIALGRDVSGQPVVADLARMPHLLIAGTTGSGKSVCIEALTTCLVMNNQPTELRLALLDPKMVELVRFNGLPHLFGRVETELDRMLGVLRWAIMEMDRRYRLLEEARTRDVITYNKKMEKRGQPTLPRIVVMIDELADLMMTAPDQTEHSLIRLAQMARATGIHLIVATQRPSTDVVTGLIKANFPARLAFTVASSIDSRVILDYNGAESLLGKGDMLFLNPEAGTPTRAQGALVSDPEIERVIAFWKEEAASIEPEPAPWEALIESSNEEEGNDALVEQAIKIVRATQRASTSLIQRRLRIGYPRAARLMDELEELGVVGPSQGGGREREVLLPPEEGNQEPAADDADQGGTGRSYSQSAHSDIDSNDSLVRRDHSDEQGEEKAADG